MPIVRIWFLIFCSACTYQTDREPLSKISQTIDPNKIQEALQQPQEKGDKAIQISQQQYLGHQGFSTTHNDNGILKSNVLANSLGLGWTIMDFAQALEENSKRPVSVDVAARKRTQTYNFDYKGSLKGLLDQASSRFDITWQLSEGGIILHGLETENFSIPSFAGQLTRSTHVTAGVGRGQHAETQRALQDLSVLDPWGELTSQVIALAGEDSKVNSSPSLGVLTVQARPSAIKRIRHVVEQTLKTMSTQIMMDVEVYDLHLSEHSAMSVNLELEALFPTTSFSSQGLAGVNVPNLNLGMGVMQGALKGTKAMLALLGKHGSLQMQQKARLTTVSGRPAPLHVGREVSFVEQLRRGVEGDGVTRFSEIQAGKIMTGFALEILPKILRDYRLMVQVDAQLTELLNISDYQTGSDSIQLPEIATRHILETVIIKPGQSMVVAGFQQRRSEHRKQGPGWHELFMLPGGSQQRSHDHILSIVILTPYLQPFKNKI